MRQSRAIIEVLKPNKVLAPIGVLSPASTRSRSVGEAQRSASAKTPRAIGQRRRVAPAGFTERVAGMAHDARNLLSAFSVYCDLLAGPGVLAPRYRHYARDLRRMGETGVGLLDRLTTGLAAMGSPAQPTGAVENDGASHGSDGTSLNGASLERRYSPPIRDLRLELAEMEDLLRSLAGREVRFELECAPCSGELGLSAEDLLRILINLVTNAVEAIRCDARKTASRPPGFLRITAQRGGGASFLAGTAAERSASVVISVRDNGPGIAAEQLPRIFEPGYSTRPGRARPSDSAACRGLGLAVVRQLAEAAGGTVRAISTPGFGSRFDLEFPVLSASPSVWTSIHNSTALEGEVATHIERAALRPANVGSSAQTPALALAEGHRRQPKTTAKNISGVLARGRVQC